MNARTISKEGDGPLNLQLGDGPFELDKPAQLGHQAQVVVRRWLPYCGVYATRLVVGNGLGGVVFARADQLVRA